MNAFGAVARREAGRLFSNRLLVFLLFAWPVLYGVFLASIYGAKVVTGMATAVCDEDGSYLSRLAVRYIDAARFLDVKYRPSGPAELEAMVMDGRVEAAVYIPRGFSRDIKRGRPGVMTAFVNGGNLLVGNLASSDIKGVAGTMAAGAKMKFLRKAGNSGQKAMADYSPVKMETFRLFNPGGNYLNYLLPGIWATILQQLMLAFASLLLVSEAEAGTLGGAAAAAGGSVPLLMAGKFLPYCAVFFLTFELFLRGLYPAFGVESAGSVTLSMALSALFIYATIGAGAFISAVVKTRMDAMKGVLLVGAPALLLSGYIWPVSYMPFVIRPVALCIPLTHYLEGLRRIYQYGAGPLDVAGSAGALFAMGTLTFAGAYFLLARRLSHEN